MKRIAKKKIQRSEVSKVLEPALAHFVSEVYTMKKFKNPKSII